jgi:translation initiation factor IF-3
MFGLLKRLSGHYNWRIEQKFHLNIREPDYRVKMCRAEESLANEVTVKLQLKFRGSEMARNEEGISLIRRMITDLSGMGIVDVEPQRVGRYITITLSPLPPDKRVRKFVP